MIMMRHMFDRFSILISALLANAPIDLHGLQLHSRHQPFTKLPDGFES